MAGAYNARMISFFFCYFPSSSPRASNTYIYIFWYSQVNLYHITQWSKQYIDSVPHSCYASIDVLWKSNCIQFELLPTFGTKSSWENSLFFRPWNVWALVRLLNARVCSFAQQNKKIVIHQTHTASDTGRQACRWYGEHFYATSTWNICVAKILNMTISFICVYMRSVMLCKLKNRFVGHYGNGWYVECQQVTMIWTRHLLLLIFIIEYYDLVRVNFKLENCAIDTRISWRKYSFSFIDVVWNKGYHGHFFSDIIAIYMCRLDRISFPRNSILIIWQVKQWNWICGQMCIHSILYEYRTVLSRL